MNIVPLKKPPSDLAQRLRELADLADEGRVTGATMAYVCDGQYEFLFASSLSDGIVLSTLLQQNCIDRTRA